MAKKGQQNGNDKEIPLPSAQETLTSVRPKPLVFISHDSRDADLAEAFGNLLTDASGGVLRSFRSSDKKGNAGIEFGEEWYKTIMESLSDATDVVALLTTHSVGRPWILYEAGVAKGKLGSRVFGLAIGVPLEKASVGPFYQFQNCGDDEDSLTKLVLQLIKKNPEAQPRDEAVRRQVQAFRTNIGDLAKARAQIGPPRMDETSVAKLFEEVKVMFRELPTQLETSLRAATDRASRRKRYGVETRSNLGEIHSLLARPSSGTQEAIGWALFAGLVKEDVPWLADLAFQMNRFLVTGESKSAANSRKGIRAMLETRELHFMRDTSNPEVMDALSMLRHALENYEASGNQNSKVSAKS